MKPTEARIRAEQELLEVLLIGLPDNPIDWVIVLKLVGPLIARLATRYALKRIHRTMSEDKVSAVSREISKHIADIIQRRTGQDAGAS